MRFVYLIAATAVIAGVTQADTKPVLGWSLIAAGVVLALAEKSGLLRVVIWAFTGLVLLILLVSVPLYATWGVTLAKAQADVQHLASAVDQYQAHMGAPPATLAELTSPATNARGQTAGPYLASIPRASSGFSDYRYERHADGHWKITTSGRGCGRSHRNEDTWGYSVIQVVL